MAKNIFSLIFEKSKSGTKEKVILACRNSIGKALDTYCKSPAHSIDILKGIDHLREQIHRIKTATIKSFSEQVVDDIDCTKVTIGNEPVSKEYLIRHLRYWLRRQQPVAGLTTHSLNNMIKTTRRKR